jgi:hypothetical protein
MTYQETIDKLVMIQREDGAYALEPFIAEEYGTGTWMATIVLKTDVYSTAMERITQEFQHYFFDAKHGLVIG